MEGDFAEYESPAGTKKGHLANATVEVVLWSAGISKRFLRVQRKIGL